MVDISICLPIIYILFSTPTSVTPGEYCRKFLVGVCCTVHALNPYPILGQKMSFFIFVFRPGLLNSIPVFRSFLKEFMSSLVIT